MTTKKPATKKQAKPRKPIQKKSTTPVTDKYRATALIMGRPFVQVGPTVQDTVASLKVARLVGRAILIVENLETKRRQERVLQPNLVKRLFQTSGISREVALKQVTTLFGV